MKIAVVTDSGSNIYNEDLHVDGLFAIPLQITDGGKTYLESQEISIDDVNELMSQQHVLTTSLPALGMIEDLFTKLKEEGYEMIFAVPITSGISGTLNAMKSAADFVGIAFDYVDCFTTFHIQLDIALAARQFFNEGLSPEDVKERVKNTVSHSDTIVIPDDLKHLSRGGRLSPLAATLGGFLKIKPILHLNEESKGVIDPMDKVRTMSKAITTVIDNLKKAGVDSNYKITIAHVRALETCNLTVEKLKEAFPNTEIRIRDLISTVSVHVGLGSIALQYAEKIEGYN